MTNEAEVLERALRFGAQTVFLKDGKPFDCVAVSSLRYLIEAARLPNTPPDGDSCEQRIEKWKRYAIHAAGLTLANEFHRNLIDDAVAMMRTALADGRLRELWDENARLRADRDRLVAREAVVCEALGGVCDGGAYVNDIVAKADKLRAERDDLLALMDEVLAVVARIRAKEETK